MTRWRIAVPRRLRENRGQTALEYLMLLAVTFIASYIVVTGPMANFTRSMLATIRNNIENVVRTGEMSEGEVITPGTNQHPGSPNRMRPLHL